MALKMPENALPLLMRALELNPNLFMTKISMGEALQAMNIFGSRFTTGQEFILPGGVANKGRLDYRYLARWEGVVSNNMGLAYEYLKEPAKAIKAYKTAVAVNPAYDLAWYNLTLLAVRRGDRRVADEALEQHVQI